MLLAATAGTFVLSFGVSRMVAQKKSPGAGGESTSLQVPTSRPSEQREVQEHTETSDEEEVTGDSLDSLPLASEKKKKKARHPQADVVAAPETPKPPSSDLASELDRYRTSQGQAAAEAASSEGETDDAAKTAPSPPKAPTPAPTAASKPEGAAPKPGGDPEDCLTPTYVDDDGIRHIKKHCL